MQSTFIPSDSMLLYYSSLLNESSQLQVAVSVCVVLTSECYSRQYKADGGFIEYNSGTEIDGDAYVTRTK
jgi:hypothetical protein